MVKSWLYGTISLELSDMVPCSRSSVRSVWLSVESRFLGNVEMCALHLDVEFQTFARGDLSITNYWRCL